jgi:hypothetical protein
MKKSTTEDYDEESLSMMRFAYYGIVDEFMQDLINKDKQKLKKQRKHHGRSLKHRAAKRIVTGRSRADLRAT